MIFTSPTAAELLANVPDFCDWATAQAWIEVGQAGLYQIPHDCAFACLDGTQIDRSATLADRSASCFGLYASAEWRKFAMATFLADLLSYRHPVDQVSFDRLLFVIHAFSEGFRVWWVKFSEIWWPVGYSGWYPMLEGHFELFQKQPHLLKNRMVVPAPTSRDYLYFFNYSVMPSLKKSDLSKALMRHFVQDIQQLFPKGMACITVSEEGAQIATRFGMQCTGQLIIDGCAEGVWVANCK